MRFTLVIDTEWIKFVVIYVIIGLGSVCGLLYLLFNIFILGRT